MQDQVNATRAPLKRVPWNKGKVTGVKPPLRPKHVWSIRTKLQIEGRSRDLAMFNLAIDSKLRGCDVVAIRVEDVAASGYTADRATIRQTKTGRPVRFELSESTSPCSGPMLKGSDSAMALRVNSKLQLPVALKVLALIVVRILSTPRQPRPCAPRDKGPPLCPPGRRPRRNKQCAMEPAPCRQLRNEPSGDRPGGLFYAVRAASKAALAIPRITSLGKFERSRH
jgi:hypothetical protein